MSQGLSGWLYVLRSLASALSFPSPRVDDNAVISPAECKQLLMECHEIMCAACDLVHARCAKILAIRAKVRMSWVLLQWTADFELAVLPHLISKSVVFQVGLLENLVSSDFVSLVKLTERFVSRSTQVTGRHCPNLRSALLSQVSHSLIPILHCTVSSFHATVCLIPIPANLFLYSGGC